MTDFSLSYSGEKIVESNANQQAHDLLDALLDAHAADNAISVDTGQVRPQESELVLIVSLSSKADMATLADVEQSLGRALVDLGVEPDTETAIESIQINSA
jgi:hypothetical protein